VSLLTASQQLCDGSWPAHSVGAFRWRW
jgi:hypothetical protein